MVAYTFLGLGARGLIDRRSWSMPNGEAGEWVTGPADGPTAARGHLSDDLPYWLDDTIRRVVRDREPFRLRDADASVEP